MLVIYRVTCLLPAERLVLLYGLASAWAKLIQIAHRRLHQVWRSTCHPPSPPPRAHPPSSHTPHCCHQSLLNRVLKATGQRKTAAALQGGGGRVGGAAPGQWMRETTTRSKQTPPWPCCRLSRAGTAVGEPTGSNLRWQPSTNGHTVHVAGVLPYECTD